MALKRIISGGQTGVDRGALDAAQRLGLEAGGWCPRGRRAEDGRIPSQYPLTELDSPEYAARTAKNVREADATLILNPSPELSGGTLLTRRLAREAKRPFLVLALDAGPHESLAIAARRFVAQHRVATLNVAGPRESGAPGIQALARELLERAFGE